KPRTLSIIYIFAFVICFLTGPIVVWTTVGEMARMPGLLPFGGLFMTLAFLSHILSLLVHQGGFFDLGGLLQMSLNLVLLGAYASAGAWLLTLAMKRMLKLDDDF